MWKGTLLKLILRKVSKTWFISISVILCSSYWQWKWKSSWKCNWDGSAGWLVNSYAVCENWNMYQILKKIWNNKMQSANLNHESTYLFVCFQKLRRHLNGLFLTIRGLHSLIFTNDKIQFIYFFIVNKP